MCMYYTETVELKNGELTKKGFLDLNQMEAEDNQGDTEDLWVTLTCMGFNKDLVMDEVGFVQSQLQYCYETLSHCHCCNIVTKPGLIPRFDDFSCRHAPLLWRFSLKVVRVVSRSTEFALHQRI